MAGGSISSAKHVADSGTVMDYLADTHIRSEAARLGYLGQSLDKLGEVVTKGVEGHFYKQGAHLRCQRAKTGEKLKSIEKTTHELTKKTFQRPIKSRSIPTGGIGLFVAFFLIHVGRLLPVLGAPMMICLGIAGALVVQPQRPHIEFWKPILFASLAVLAMIITTVSLYNSGLVWLIKVPSGLCAGIAVYILSETLFTATNVLYEQTLAIFLRIRLWVAERIYHSRSQRYRTYSEKIDSLERKRRRIIEKNMSLISYPMQD